MVSSTPTGITLQATSSPSVTLKGGSRLSGGAKAGIAVGSILGAALVFAALFFAIRRKRGSKDTEAAVQPTEKTRAASIGSAETAQ